MKRLILMRHAKSDWDDPLLPDHDRPLADRGRRGAELVGGWLREEGYLPDLALVSTSTRTRETWALASASLPPCPARFEPTLYHAAPPVLLARLREAEGDCALLLAHQPGIGAFAERLLSRPFCDPDFARYPTAAVAVIDFDADSWAAVATGAGRLADFTTPRRLG